MLHNFLTTAWRRAKRHPGQTLINVCGLAAGTACCLLILLFVRFELGFDTFHEKSDRIHRLNKVDTPESGSPERHAVSSGLMGPTLVDDFPEVEAAVRILPWFDDVVHSRDKASTKLSLVLFADRNVFDVFDFSLRRGDPETALAAPMSIILTPDVAEALFGDEDPIGKSVLGVADQPYTVTGIVEPAPEQSHLQFEALVSWSSSVPGEGPLEFHWMNNWLTQSLYTYVLLRQDADPRALERRFPAFMQMHFAERADQYALYLQPLRDVYLGSSDVLHARKIRSGNRMHVYAFITIGLLVLFVAVANFVNLSTATARRRMSEVGIRKALGASRRRLAIQFVVETVFVSVPSVLIAAAAVQLAIPVFRRFTGREIPFEVLSPEWLVGLFAAALVLASAAGAYPALVQSAYEPARALRGDRGILGLHAVRRGLPRRILVAGQFAVSIALVIATAVVYRQMDFVQSAHLGYAADQIIVMNIGGTALEERYVAFEEQLRRHPDVIQVASGKNVPGHGTMSFTLRPEGRSDDEVWTAPVQRIAGPEMLETYGLKMIQGRFFSSERPSELQRGVVINQALARRLGWANPIGKRLDVDGEIEGGEVIGVVEDFHFESMHRPIDPTVLIVDTTGAGYVSVRVAGSSDLHGTLEFVEEQWQAFEARYPFEYVFLDEAFGAFYASDRRLMTTIGLFSMLAVVIACLGLFGLAAYLAEERTKEIGIRKVLGASVSRILVLLSRETVGLVVIAFVTAVPVAYMVANRWLETFSYSVDVTGWTIAGAGALVLLLALSTVSYQALRAATADPVKALRDE